ncbi:PP2C family serine/threonine-protein phosphatase [Aeoliella mucimassa]|uniref:PPM-type phosphatase domain-containing protein n=1 Tax=Aeoliella mucimassa TaxID=2527972 RepID=A0A518AL65_9BACT|nr:PP2C family serine/threonine-protein phosphatase [Aeoliella mucimassa]QDU55469.1 hypothetical protein Pan181_16580 [Aeoliella mucimassa]
MSHFETTILVEAYRQWCEDRVAVFEAGERTVIVVADGAGGIGAGDIAAEAVLREVEAALPHVHSADQWADTLRQIDCRLSQGESTAVVVDIRPYGLAGASVGDSEAWIIKDGNTSALTVNQIRKPLLGSGNASPVSFMQGKLDGLLLVATDGFFSYVKPSDLLPMIAQADFFSIPRKCVEMVQLPSGELWDDIGIVAARVKPQHRTRERYTI